jgi:hypothetical protein
MASCSICGLDQRVGDHGICRFLESAGEQVLRAFRSLGEEERKWVNIVLAEHLVEGRSEILTELFSDYVHIPPTPSQFLDDDYYLGPRVTKHLWPELRRMFLEIYEGNFFEIIFTGAIGWGKTTLAQIILLFEIARILCHRDIRAYYNLMPGRPVVIGLFNLTMKLALEVNYLPVRNMAMESPFFQKFLHDERQRTIVKIQGDKLLVALGSDAVHALGRDIWAGMIDEANFKAPSKDVNAVVDEYIAVYRRIESRFMQQGHVPGKLILSSSKKFSTSFLEEHIESAKRKDTAYIVDHPQYTVLPRDRFKGPTFQVMIGDKFMKPRILDPGEEVKLAGVRVENVPVEYRDTFDADLEEAIRDICGVQVRPVASLFPRMDIVAAHVKKVQHKHPFGREIIDIDVDSEDRIEDYLLLNQLCSQHHTGTYRPRYYPAASRFVHLDLSKNKDGTGICMGCPGPRVQVERWDQETGETQIEVLPTVHIDFVLKLKALKGGEIPMPKIRSFLLYLRNILNFHILQTTADQYQSVNILQDLSVHGIRVQTFSVDRTDTPYLTTKEALMEGRVGLYWTDMLMAEDEGEFHFLIHDREKHKVDHDKNGEKDASDALVAVTTAILVPAVRAPVKSTRQATGPPVGQVPAAVAHLVEGLEEQGDQSGLWTHAGEAPGWLVDDYDE